MKGEQLEVSSSRIVAGIEPEKTNKFLVALSECATSLEIDHVEAVRRCLAGQLPARDNPSSRVSVLYFVLLQHQCKLYTNVNNVVHHIL